MRDAYCARAVIITDIDGHQFTGFFPGPVPGAAAWQQHLDTLELPACELFIQAPYPPELMLTALTHAGRLPTPPLRIWCPGQYADQLQPNQARHSVAQCDWIVGNHYEIGHLSAHSDLTGKLIIQTNSGAPVEITFPNGAHTTVPLTAVADPVDPTGCGDAFLAGLTHMLLKHPPAAREDALADAVTAGHTQAVKCLQAVGGQPHHLLADLRAQVLT